jgi:hypothetical protein
VALTDADLYVNANGDRKAGQKCPFKGVQKRADISRAMTCFEYLRARNNENARLHGQQVEALRAEGKEAEAAALEQAGPKEHELQPRRWGERIQGTPFIRHKDNMYLELMLRKAGPASASTVTSYFDENGQEIDKAALAPWIKKRAESESDPQEFWYREYRTDHIVEVRAFGEVYIVRELAAYARTKEEQAAA